MKFKKNLPFIFCICIYNIMYSQREIKIDEQGAAPNFVPIKSNVIPNCSYLNSSPVLFFNDEFNNNTLDLSKWNPQLPWGIANGDSSDTWCDPNEILFTGYSVKFGVNKTYNDNILIDGRIESRNYSNGTISSKQEFSFGYYQIRCKIPRIAELWPAFWLYGNCGQEIDVFEFNGAEFKSSKSKIFHDRLSACTPHLPRWYMPQECASARPIMTYHSPDNKLSPCTGNITAKHSVGRYLNFYSWGVKKTLFNFNKGCVYDNVNVDIDFHQDWHTFGLAYTPEGITWFIDSVPQIIEHKFFKKQFNGIFLPACLADYCFSGDSVDIYEQINFPQPNIFMNAIIGNGHRALMQYNLTRSIDEIKNWPDGYLEVDYFRYYKFTDVDKNSLFCKTDLPTNWKSNLVVFPNPSDGNFIIKTNDSLNKKHFRIIDFMGSEIETGSFQEQDYPISIKKSPGLYLLEVIIDKKTNYQKFIIQ